MVTRPDLRLLPAACAVWMLAAIGTVQGPRAALSLLAVGVVIALCAAMLSGRAAAARILAGHLGLVAVLVALLMPGLLRYDAARSLLERASDDGLVVTATARATSGAEAPRSASPWDSGSVTFLAELGTAPLRVGRDIVRPPAHVRILVRGDGDAAVPGDPALSLEAIDQGDRVRVRGTVSVDGTLVVLRVRGVEAVDPARGVRADLRATARRTTAGLPADEAALVRGMTSGDTHGLSTGAEEAMRRAGLSHLVAVSGANIALVLAAVLGPLLLLGVPRRFRILAASAVGGAYVSLVGDQPSVLRAATMAAPLLLARLVGVRGSPIAALAATIAGWSVLVPQTAASIGFVLSALATGGILALAPPCARILSGATGGRLGETVALVVAVPLVAQIACTPILVLLAPEVSLWTVAANMAVAPVVGPATVIGLVALVLGPVWPGAAHAIQVVAAGSAHVVLLVAGIAAELPGSRIAVPGGATGMLLAAVAIVLALLVVAQWRRPLVRWGAAAIAVALLVPVVITHLPFVRPAGEDWTIAACAVGQGDATVLRGPPTSGAPEVVLIDTGPKPEALTACLDLLRIDRIDLLVLTHPHADHVDGRSALTGSRTPRRQWACPSEEARRATLPGVPVEQVVRGRTEQLPGLRLDVLWPTSAEDVRRVAARESSAPDQGGANDCSVVLAASWADGTRFLGLGDLEPEAQGAFAALAPGHADVVKVAHHGSRRQDPELYALIQPDIAVIEVGETNTFGHPAPATLTLLTALPAPTIRTDRDGTSVIGPAPGSPGALEVRRVGPPR
ncbi:ComEC/Rec2 family competence protein [Brachybacterium huguangmaarense]